MGASILTDLTRCIGCGACTLVCKETNDLRASEVDQLDAYTWCAISKQQGLYVKRQCMHCLEPTCVSVCPVGALQKTAAGPVTYDPDKCFGCRYCVMACPFGIPKYQWDTPLPRMGKCVMCYEKRLQAGQEPACTAVCPAHASVFGDRDELLAVAHERLAAEPDKYVPEVYGEHLAGGTSVLYISSVAFGELGFPTGLLDQPYPRLTWAVLSKIPAVVSVGGLTLLTAWWVIGRRIKLAEEHRHAAAAAAAAPKGGEGAAP
jgi:formate dehydrogenase iron-sulfur subunit